MRLGVGFCSGDTIPDPVPSRYIVTMGYMFPVCKRTTDWSTVRSTISRAKALQFDVGTGPLGGGSTKSAQGATLRFAGMGLLLLPMANK